MKNEIKIGIIDKHAQALEYMRAAKTRPPVIPRGMNTAWKHFDGPDGSHCIAINQTGFAPTVEDNEEECNGLMIAVAVDAERIDPDDVRNTLEKWFLEFMDSPELPAEEQGMVSFNLPMSEKSRWVNRAQSAGLTLVEWIRSRCNKD